MLNVGTLEKQLKQAFDEVLPGALAQALQTIMPEKSESGTRAMKRFSETATDLISGDLAARLAQAIDYYVKNATIFGTVITVGGPFSQTAQINSPTPLINGKVPNTLGIK